MIGIMIIYRCMRQGICQSNGQGYVLDLHSKVDLDLAATSIWKKQLAVPFANTQAAVLPAAFSPKLFLPNEPDSQIGVHLAVKVQDNNPFHWIDSSEDQVASTRQHADFASPLHKVGLNDYFKSAILQIQAADAVSSSCCKCASHLSIKSHF